MFIVIDGLDGSGNGTQTQLVKTALEKQGKRVLMLDYPRYGETSAFMVEKYLNGGYGSHVSPKLASIFYAIDRFEDSFNFKERTGEYDYIISNRYVSASMIHQTGKIESVEERISFMNWLHELEFEIFGIPKPDKILFLDVPPEVSQKLIEKKEERAYITWGKKKDLHEADENHLKNAYEVAHQILNQFPDWIQIQCCKNGEILPIDTITKKILNSLN